MKRTAEVTILLALAVALGFGGAALAHEPDAEPASAPAPAAEAADAVAAPEGTIPVTFAGMRVFVDEKTGRLRPPTEEEARQLRTAVRRLYDTRRQLRRTPQVDKSGNQSVVLGFEDLKYSMVRVEGDGTLSTTCSSSAEEAAAFIAGSAPTSDHLQ